MRYLRTALSAKKAALSVALIVFAIFFIYPMFFVVINSLRPMQGIITNPTGFPNSKVVSLEYFDVIKKELSRANIDVKYDENNPNQIELRLYGGGTKDFSLFDVDITDRHNEISFTANTLRDGRIMDQIANVLGESGHEIDMGGHRLTIKNKKTEYSYYNFKPFDNYFSAWREMQFPNVFLNTLLITVIGTAGIVLTSSMCAYGLARSDSKLSWILYGFFAFSLVIPFQIIMVPIGILAADLKMMNVPGIIIMYWGLGCPTAIFMIHGFIKGVPKELEESAAIDGAGRFYIFFRIVFPLIKTIVATVIVIDALWLWNDFLLPLIVIKKGTIQLAQMNFRGISTSDYGKICASLTLSSIPMIALYIVLQKYIIKGIAAGAVKG